MSTTTKLTARCYLTLLVEPVGRFVPDSPDCWPGAFHVLPFDYSADEACMTLAESRAQVQRLNAPQCIAWEHRMWAITVRDWNDDCPSLPGYVRLSHPDYAIAFARKGGE